VDVFYTVLKITFLEVREQDDVV